MIVVVEYDRQTGMVQADTYDDANYELARTKTFERERELLHTHPQREVVLLNGPSVEAIKKTYPKYFDTREKLPDDYRGSGMSLHTDMRKLTELLLDIFKFDGESRKGIRALDLRLEVEHAPILKVEYVKDKMEFEGSNRSQQHAMRCSDVLKVIKEATKQGPTT